MDQNIKNESEEEKVLKKNSLNYKRLLQGNYSKLILFIALIVVVALPSLAIGYSMGKNNSENLYSEIPLSPSPTQSPTPSPSPTPTALPEINTTQANPNYGKIALHIDSIKWEDGHAAGLITDARVKLFKIDGTFIEEKTPTPYVQNGPVGSGGDTVFYVTPSTYKITSEAGSKYGECTVTVRTTTEYNSCAIYLVEK